MTSTEIAHQPNKEFVHQVSDGCACAICGTTARPLALHVLERSYSRDAAIPKGFLVMSMSVDEARGVFPVCDHCAPACPTCGLPVETAQVQKFKKSTKAKSGDGVCSQHGNTNANFGERLKSMFKHAFKIGRGEKR